MKNNKISLVFCCYNVSDYLDSIFELILSQPYEDFEAIFVEDCSTDDTKNKLRTFSKEPRIRVIENQKNLGASESRNVGMAIASGDYIGFPDSDDLFDLNWLLEISEIIRIHRPPVIISGMREDYEVDGHIEYSKSIISKYSGLIESDFNKVLIDLEETMLFGYMNNKFYKRNILTENNILSKTMPLKEDFDFNIQFFNQIDSFYIFNKPSYFYKKRINGSSLSSKFVSEYFHIHENSVSLLKLLLEKKGEITEEAKALLVNRFYRYFMSAIERNVDTRSGLSTTQQIDWVKKILTNPKYCFFTENEKLISGKLRFIKRFFRPDRALLLITVGHIFRLIKRVSPVLFARLK